MDTVFSVPSSTGDIFDASVLDRYYEHLLSTLQQAHQQAHQSGHPIIASFTTPYPPHDALTVFSAFAKLQVGERFFWESSAAPHALVGVGNAHEVITEGQANVESAIAGWQMLRRDMVTSYIGQLVPWHAHSPRLFGAFAFNPQLSHTELWNAFPDGLLHLPRLLFECADDSATLTANSMVQANDDVGQVAEELLAAFVRLHELLEQKASSLHTGKISIATRDIMPASTWMALVSQLVEHIRNKEYKKVVLARALEAIGDTEAFSIDATLSHLRTHYPEAFTFAIQRGQRYFVGATPEQLLRVQDSQVQTMALAGSAPRGNNEQEDQRLGMELLNSAKNRHEHEIVAATLRDTLATLCSDIWMADTPELLRLQNIQHLKTPVMGTLLPDRTILDAVAQLHPTPAVGGFPRTSALAALRDYEHLDRGWYAAPIGWLDLDGNGEFAVALRSALVSANIATLFAGCGIVADSDPQSEYDESCLKFAVMLRALTGID